MNNTKFFIVVVAVLFLIVAPFYLLDLVDVLDTLAPFAWIGAAILQFAVLVMGVYEREINFRVAVGLGITFALTLGGPYFIFDISDYVAIFPVLILVVLVVHFVDLWWQE